MSAADFTSRRAERATCGHCGLNFEVAALPITCPSCGSQYYCPLPDFQGGRPGALEDVAAGLVVVVDEEDE